MPEHFTILYEPIENDGDVNNLESNIHIPITDDPITIEELVTSSNLMRKGGFDYPFIVLQILVSGIPLNILNLQKFGQKFSLPLKYD